MNEQPPTTPAPDVVTRLGGQPSWLTGPVWPISSELDVPMTFLAQVVLRDSPLTLAYVFMTQDDEEDGLETWIPDGGENAVVIQPGGVTPAGVRTEPLRTGPGLTLEGEAYQLVVPAGGHPAVQVGGAPDWLQDDERPGPGWQLAMQVDSSQVPAFIDFGDAGLGYVFVTGDLARGAFLWQCT